MGGVTISIQRFARPPYVCRLVMRENGKLTQQQYLKTKSEAETLKAAWVAKTTNSGAKAAASITLTDERNLLNWWEKLSPYGKTPSDAVAYYLAYLERCKTSISVLDLCDKFQALKTSENKSRRYLDDIHYRLGIFCANFGARVAADVTTDEISKWLGGMKSAPQTKKNYRTIVRSVFNYAVSLKACAENPVDGAFKPAKADTQVGILKVNQAAALLSAAHDRPEILPAIAIGLFGGVRDAEIHRLDWNDIDFESGFITITPKIAKKRARRLIELRPALRAWLEPHRQISGPIWPAGERGRILTEAVREAAGVTPWPHNALRHSFASYALAKWQNAASLALEMGNSAPVILEHYRELVLPRDAEAFWNLTPDRVLSITNVLAVTTSRSAKRRSARVTKAS